MSEKTNIATLDYLNEYDPAIGNALTTAVVSLSRITLGIFVCEQAAH